MEKTYPAIEDEAKKTDSTIYFEDESSVLLNITTGKTWAKKGETPVIYKSGQRTKCLMASAISNKGNLFFRTYEFKGMNAERYEQFLKDLQKSDGGKIIVIHDKLPTHRSKRIKKLQEQNKKIKCYELPGYSPELNPDEFVWAIAKSHIGKRSYKTMEDLRKAAINKLRSIQKNSELLIRIYMKVYS